MEDFEPCLAKPGGSPENTTWKFLLQTEWFAVSVLSFKLWEDYNFYQELYPLKREEDGGEMGRRRQALKTARLYEFKTPSNPLFSYSKVPLFPIEETGGNPGTISTQRLPSDFFTSAHSLCVCVHVCVHECTHAVFPINKFDPLKYI